MQEQLALVSLFNPEAAFDVGNAEARNRYIYSLAEAAVVVTSSEGKGGTWNGAIQNLRQGSVPRWVKPGTDEGGSGNSALVDRGGHWLPQTFRISDLSSATTEHAESHTDGDVPRLNALHRPDHHNGAIPGRVGRGAIKPALFEEET